MFGLSRENEYPALFEKHFVYKGSSLTSEAVVSRLKFPTSMDDEEKRVNGFLTEFLLGVCLMCEPARHASHCASHASHASQGATHASHASQGASHKK